MDFRQLKNEDEVHNIKIVNAIIYVAIIRTTKLPKCSHSLSILLYFFLRFLLLCVCVCVFESCGVRCDLIFECRFWNVLNLCAENVAPRIIAECERAIEWLRDAQRNKRQRQQRQRLKTNRWGLCNVSDGNGIIHSLHWPYTVPVAAAAAGSMAPDAFKTLLFFVSSCAQCCEPFSSFQHETNVTSALCVASGMRVFALQRQTPGRMPCTATCEKMMYQRCTEP